MTNYARFFERKTRDNGETFYSLTDDRPEWLHDAVRDAHDGELPNDWRFDTCHSIVEIIDENALHGSTLEASELADSLVDVYTSDLLEWLSDDVSRTAYVNEAIDEGLTAEGTSADIESQIRAGQYLAIERMAQILIDATPTRL